MTGRDAKVAAISLALGVAVAVLLFVSLFVVEEVEEARAPDPQGLRLALTVVPTFCALRPEMPACAAGAEAAVQAPVALHGLWPQPPSLLWCAVPDEVRANAEAGRFAALPPLDLSPEVSARLAGAMLDPSFTRRYQWYKHGSCSGMTPEAYYRLALDLYEAARPAVAAAVEGADGDIVTLAAVRAALDGALGEGTGARAFLVCVPAGEDGARAVLDVRIDAGLPAPGLAAPGDLIAAAAPVEAGPCAAGRTDGALRPVSPAPPG